MIRGWQGSFWDNSNTPDFSQQRFQRRAPE
jgi:hypothetical protein